MKILDSLEEWLVTLLIGAATVVTFVAVVHRYSSGLPIPGLQERLIRIDMSWAQELTIIMFVWMAKFGAAYGVRTGIHVGVDVLINTLSDRVRRGFIIFGLLAGALFTGIIATLGAHFVWHNGAHHALFGLFGLDAGGALEGPTTVDLEWPTWIVYSAIPLGSALMCFRFLQVCVAFVRTGELPHHDQAHVDGIDDVREQVEHPDSSDLHPRDLHHDDQKGGPR